VGCTVTAEVVNGVWVGQEPSWDSPINRGSHCAKGASVRELVSGERRLKYPMKLVNARWTRISWDQAVDEIGDKLTEIRGQSGADSVYWLGSAKMTNEGPTYFASSEPSGAPTTRITRRVFVIRPRSWA
jgi:formate dehydrogenase major subunit